MSIVRKGAYTLERTLVLLQSETTGTCDPSFKCYFLQEQPSKALKATSFISQQFNCLTLLKAI